MSDPDIIYLNHAGTSWPSPESVALAASAVMHLSPASWPDLFEQSRRTVAEFFHVDPLRLLLTPSCTAALNVAIMDHMWKPGDQIITSHYEHHAVHRNLVKLQEHAVDVKTLPSGGDELIDLDVLESELKSNDVRLLAITAACNVTGRLLPIADAIDLAHRFGTLVLIDGAQIAGWWDMDVHTLGADLFTFAGHKGLQSPWGIGGLIVAPHVTMNCPQAACERADSEADSHCALMPGYCDVGSVNYGALAGLAAGCRWLSDPERQNRLEHARGLAREFRDAIRRLPRVVIHDDVAMEQKMPTVAMTVRGTSSVEIAKGLRQKGLIVSGGFQCPPQAHNALGTDKAGVIRISFGPLNAADDVAGALEAMATVIR
ncbi:MAG: aminotransferase class V-fold PLP-dependent enzyme [Fuerstiella sp.]|nr:aminotransferase class V-fold PLP-dependent enzyme [Fuerstiella sp.]MCP4854927.1 aminotransferase class V-fold PLP-dependent enzyme [Fuerstiella sp.]